MSKEEILKRLHEAVVDMEEDAAVDAAEDALDEGVEALEAVMDGLVEGIAEVGELYDEGEYYVPEVLLASEALYAALDVLQPHVDAEDLKLQGDVVIGVAEGDVHDIGKNLVGMMFDVFGMSVIDLGKDVPLENYVEEYIDKDADLIAISAMMTSTMLGIPDVVDMAKKEAPDAKIICGGAPVTEESAEEWGADGFAPAATDAVDEAIMMVEELREAEKEAAEAEE